MGPNLGQVQDVVSELLSLFGSHGLDVHGPGRELLALDRIEEILLGVVGVFTSNLDRLGLGKVLDTLVATEVELFVVMCQSI